MRKFALTLASQPGRPKTIEADSYAAENGLLQFWVGHVLVFATAVSNVVKFSEVTE